MIRILQSIALAVTVTLTAAPSFAQLRAQLVTSGLSSPVAFVQDSTRPNVQFIVQQGGRIRVLQDGVLLSQDYLNLTSLVTFSGEQGLLGFALDPQYAGNGRVYVNYINRTGNTVVARFTRSTSNPLTANPATQFNFVWPDGKAFITQPFTNHNGGNLVFGPDGYLYIGMGDGGSGDDPQNNAQNPLSLLGKILRLDVSVSTGDAQGYDVPPTNPFVGRAGVLPEIWAFGVRNPWRFGFDDVTRGGTGALVIGDVGQDAWEEVDYQPAGIGGRNYGWRVREGAHPHIGSLPAFSAVTDPIFEYDHSTGHSITGGVVYRGTALGAAFAGRYFFADFVNNRVWSMALTINGTTGAATAGTLTEHTAELASAASLPASFGVDASGELYVVSYAGNLYRLALATPPGGCTTPDPFVALGGGTCSNGGWLPPGVIAAPAPPPPPTPPPPPPSGGCATPDPFVAIGGGTCSNGGWLPPGVAPAAPPTTPPAPPPATPPPAPAGCTTPDPFAALGGGTCANGGWLPPGIASPAPPSTRPATPPPPAPSGSCSGNDPFANITSMIGVCVNGGWVPVAAVKTSGTVRFVSSAGGFWTIVGDDGATYEPISLASPFQSNGLRVTFQAKLRPDVANPHNVGRMVEIVTIQTP